MPLQNRVLPTGEIVATSARGTMTGNRGILHGPNKVLSKRRWTHKAWICCELEWQGRKREVMNGRNWTELFFLDEAVAFAAGHRPCGYCRRAAFNRFKEAWASVHGDWPGVKAVDQVLHQARLGPTKQEHAKFKAKANALPSGSYFRLNEQAFLKLNGDYLPYDPAGYRTARPVPDKDVDVLTPAPLIEVLRAGYQVFVHPTGKPSTIAQKMRPKQRQTPRN